MASNIWYSLCEWFEFEIWKKFFFMNIKYLNDLTSIFYYKDL